MLIEIHVIQNHCPANLNRDDLGAPKTCYFGGVLRSRISSQCIKRSIRTSDEFKTLLGGVRTRQLAKLIAEELAGDDKVEKRAEKILHLCGFEAKKGKAQAAGEDEEAPEAGERSKMLIYTTRQAIKEMANLLKNEGANDKDLARSFAELIATRTAVPDMALSGRMLEPGKVDEEVWKEYKRNVEAALQVAHAISTHEARPEVDYYVAADDIPGEDAGAGYVDEALFASACFYKYFSIHWETLVDNLAAFPGNKEHLAAHTVGAFIRAALLTNPSGKQNSFASHCRPDGVLIEIRNNPINYANAFAKPVAIGDRGDILSQSIAQLAQYVLDLDTGYGRPEKRFWFSPNLRCPFSVAIDKKEVKLADENFTSLDVLIPAVISAIGYDWQQVQKVALRPEVLG